MRFSLAYVFIGASCGAAQWFSGISYTVENFIGSPGSMASFSFRLSLDEDRELEDRWDECEEWEREWEEEWEAACVSDRRDSTATSREADRRSGWRGRYIKALGSVKTSGEREGSEGHVRRVEKRSANAREGCCMAMTAKKNHTKNMIRLLSI